MFEAHAYLHDVEQLISVRGQTRFCGSKSVRMLHSTFLYLSTLQASVRVFSGNSISENMLKSTHSTNIWDKLLDSDNSTEEAAIEDDNSTSSSSDSHVSSSIFEQVYSVPEPLFRLIGRVTLLQRRIEQHSTGRAATRDQPNITQEIADLEHDICSWKNDTPPESLPRVADALLETPSSPNHGGSREVRYHLRTAVHAAILIFFYKSIRKIDTYAVQPFVERTARSLQLYAEAKRASGDNSSCTCWPGFVAGCEALDPDMRQLMSQWFETETAQTGIRMFEMAGQAAKDVWNARDQSGDRNLPWSEILKKDNILDKLVLS